MTVRVRNPARMVIAIENQAPVRFLLVTLFEPGALQSVQFFGLVSPGVWGFYLLTRTGERVSALAGSHEASYVNRAVASSAISPAYRRMQSRLRRLGGNKPCKHDPADACHAPARSGNAPCKASTRHGRRPI
jgi:hypothetical protein